MTNHPNRSRRVTKNDICDLKRWFRSAHPDLEARGVKATQDALDIFRKHVADTFPAEDEAVLRRYDLVVRTDRLHIRLYNGKDWSDTYGVWFQKDETVVVPSNRGCMPGIYVGGPLGGNGWRIEALSEVAHELRAIRTEYTRREAEFRAFLDTKPNWGALVGAYSNLQEVTP